MVYFRPLYVASSTNSQPNLQYVVGVLGKNVQIDTSLSNVLGDLLNQTVSLPNGGTGVSSTGTLPAAVAGELATAQTDYQNALSALKAGNFATFGSDLQAMEQQLQAAQGLLGTTPGGARLDGDHDHDDGAGGEGHQVEVQIRLDDVEHVEYLEHVIHDDLGADQHRARGGATTRPRPAWCRRSQRRGLPPARARQGRGPPESGRRRRLREAPGVP